MIELLVLDVDGTLTDGKIYYSNSGEEIKSFNIKDGLMVASWNKLLNKKSAIITGRSSKIVEKRAKELGVEFIYQGVKNKEEVLKGLISKLNLSFDEVAVIGDDLNDLSMMNLTKHTFAPADANHYVYEYVSNPLKKRGGDGAVAEMIEMILKESNLYEELIKKWEK